MKHLTDEEMMEQFYGESENTTAVERHLERCRECARNFAELKRDLADVERIEAPPRDAFYGERMWTRVAPMLPAFTAAEKRSWWHSLSWQSSNWQSKWLRGLSYAAAGLLLASSAFYAGRLWEKNQTHAPIAQIETAPKPAQANQPIVVVVLDDHLDRSERFLVELKHADWDASGAPSPLRDEAKNLLAANRICRKDAAQSNDPELTTALDHLDKLLADAANEPGGMNAATISKLQDEMNAEGVLFEVRVLRSRAAKHQAPLIDPETGGTI
jgi:hypothetical protein